MRFPATILLFLSAPVLAQPFGCASHSDNRERLACYDQMSEAISQCIKYSDKLDRLSCFDDLAKATRNLIQHAPLTHPQPAPQVSTSVAPPAPVPSSQAPAQPVTQAAPASADVTFGLTERPVDEPEQIQAGVKSVVKDPYGKWTVTLDNGQSWRQTESRRFRLSSGDQVVIRKAILGSFLLSKASGSASTRVKRVN